MKHFYSVLNSLFRGNGLISYLKKSICLVSLFCIIDFYSHAQSINVTNVSSVSTCVTTGSTVTITFNVINGAGSYFTSATSYTAFLSDASGLNFMQIGSIFTNSSRTYNLTINGQTTALSQVITIPNGIYSGTGYKISLSSTSPVFIGSGGLGASPNFTLNSRPTLSSITQVGLACAGSGAVLMLNGLLPNTSLTVVYKVQNAGSNINVNVVSDAAGNATFTTVPFLLSSNFIQVQSIVSSAGCSQSFTSASMRTSTLKFNALPALISATQSGAAVCAGSGAVINLTGLASGGTFTINYTINGIPYQRAGVVATGTNASFPTVALTAANDGQVLKITGITLTSGCFKSFNFDIVLTVSPYINKTVLAVPAAVCEFNSSVIKVYSPDPRVRYQLRNDLDDSQVGVPVNSTSSPLNLPIPKGYLTGNTTFNILATDTITGCSAELLTTPTILVKTTGVTYPVANIAADYCTPGNGNVLLSSINSYSSYLWNNDSTQNNITINQAGIYNLIVTDVNGCRADTSVNIGDEQVINGNFNMGVGVGYTTQYKDTLAPGGLQTPGAGYYSIYTDALYTSNGFWGKDHTTQTGNFMIVNGTGPSKQIWVAKVKVIPNTKYYFSAWAMSLNNATPFAKLQFNVDGVNVGSVANLAAGVNNNSNNGWTRFYGAWNSGTLNDTIIIKLVNLETSSGGNDFGLDDISFSKLPPVSFFSTTLGNNGNSVCIGDTLKLTATLVGGASTFDYIWSGPGGFSSTDSSPVILNAPGGLYKLIVTEGNHCERKDSIFIILGSPTLSSLTLADACSISPITVVANLAGMVANSINNTVYYKIGLLGSKKTASGVNVNVTGNASFTISGLTIADNGKTVFIDSVNNGSCTMNVIPAKTAIIIIRNSGDWIGGPAGNWNVGANWCGGIPADGADVTVPAGSVITVPAGYTTNKVNNLTINGTLVLTNSTFRITNTITTALGSIFNATNGTVELAGNTVQSISGKTFLNHTIKSLVISNSIAAGVSTNDSLNILDTLAFSVSNATLNTRDTIVLRSTATSTARLTDITKNGTLSGNKIVGQVTVERYFPARRAWRLFTAPVSNHSLANGSIFENWQNKGIFQQGVGTYITGPGATVAGTNGLDWSPLNNSSLKAGVNLTSVSGTKTTTISKKLADTSDNIPYFIFVRGDRNSNLTTNPSLSNNTTLSSKGKLQTGRQTFIANPVFLGNTLIGNPYASPVNMANIVRNGVSPRYYVWDPYINTAQGGYVVFDDFDGNGVYEPAVQFTTLTQELQSGQAFFIETSVAGPTASIVFNEQAKSINNNISAFRPAGNLSSLRANLYFTQNGKKVVLDGILSQFYHTFNSVVDIQDALKATNSNENIAFLRNTKLLAIERRPEIILNDTLFLQLTRTTQRGYQLELKAEKFNPLLSAFLEDSFTGKSTPLNLASGTMFDFSITSDAKSAVANRFRIVFKQVATGPLPVTYKSVKAFKQANNIAVEWTVENEINISKYEVEKSGDGVSFTKVNVTTATGANRTSTTYSWLDTKPLSGNNFYRIRSISPDGSIEYSNVVLVKMGNAPSGISVYPNPVVNGIIGTEFKNMPPGVYRVKLMNQLGQTVFSKTINHAAGSSLQTIQPDNKLAAGIYQMEVTAPDHQSNTIKVIVQ